MIVLETDVYQIIKNKTKTLETVLMGICSSTYFMRFTLPLFEPSENSLKGQESLDNLKSL